MQPASSFGWSQHDLRHRMSVERRSPTGLQNSAARMHTPAQISLKRRVLNAGIWSLAGYGCNQVLRFGSNLLMTRLLVPEMFGVMAIASVVMTGLAMFSDLGLKPSVVQSKRGNDPVFLNTIWVTQILRGLLLWFLALIASLLIYFANQIGMVPRAASMPIRTYQW